MKKGLVHIGLFLLLATLSGCTADEKVDVSSVTADLAFSVSSSARQQSRMSAAVVQESGFRGLQELRAVPFLVRGRKIQATDLPKIDRINGMENSFDHTTSWFYYREHCEFMRGVASFLVYARAIPTYGTADPTIDQRMTNGALDAVFPADMNPAGITFSPKSIYGSSTADAKATAIAAYMTAIAQTEVEVDETTYKWANMTAPAIKAMYQNFIGQENVTMMDIAASSTNVLKYVNALYTQVSSLKETVTGVEQSLCDAILSTISGYPGVTFSEGKVTSLGDAMSGFPANVGLPDGAAVMRWTGTQFEPQTQTTTMDNITGIARYAYPAELYYYTNSLIKTSTEGGQKPYYDSENTWTNVLQRYEYNNGVVTPNTKAVAIIEPLQYGVGHLQVSLKRVTATLKDAADQDISIGTSLFPLTAVIVGNQHKVGFDFKPCDTEDYFMYDTKVTAGICLSSSVEQSDATHTLVLQSNDNEEIAIVLEFQNNSTQTIEGVNNGLIYPGTKFYLVTKVKPQAVAEGAEDYKKHVFTQDYITTMTMKVESFAKAYNVVPNLLSPRLEIGVQVVTDWMQAEPTNVMLE